jgi:hypothetical protein
VRWNDFIGLVSLPSLQLINEASEFLLESALFLIQWSLLSHFQPTLRQGETAGQAAPVPPPVKRLRVLESQPDALNEVHVA